MEFLRQQMSTLADNQTAIFGAVRKQIHQALQTPETRLLGVLILVWPGFIGLDVGAIGKADVHGVERDDQVLGAVDLLECLDHLGLLPHGPGERFVRDGISETHSLLVDVGKVVLVDSGRVISLETEVAFVRVSVSGWEMRMW